MNATPRLPLILDNAAKEIGYYRTVSGRLSILICKAGRYYHNPTASMASYRVSKADAASRFVPFDDGTVN